MRKIERRAAICMILSLALVFGLCVFSFRFAVNGGRWVSFAANRHLYNNKGELSVGRVLDRDGDVLSWVDENGNRTYYANAAVRQATLHAVGDAAGNIGTGALVAFADKLSGYNLFTGVYTPGGTGNDLYLTLDARYNYIAYNALNGRKGAVGVYNYKTGEILCMVSTPAFDPLDPPVIEEGDETWDGVYLNRFLSGTFTPGSVYKTVTLAAAIEQIPDLFDRTFTCTGSTVVGGETITCPHAHGELDAYSALASSCNGFFAQIAAELGAERLSAYAERSGLTGSYRVSGLNTAAGRFDAQDAAGGMHQAANEARAAARSAHDAFDEANARMGQARVDKGRLEVQVEGAVNAIVHDCKVPLDHALALPELEDRGAVEDQAFKLRRRIANMGTINPDAADEYERLKERYDYLAAQLADLDGARRALGKIVRVIDARMKDDFVRTFDAVSKNFSEIFAVLFPGGSAELSLVDPDDLENTGVEVTAQPRGKRITKMMLMSGGEKSLTALALLFAVYRIRTTPFYILDEVEAALDDSNLRRLTSYLESLRDSTQLIMITHQRRTMEMADVLFGVSMQADGVTKVVSQKLEHALRHAE